MSMVARKSQVACLRTFFCTIGILSADGNFSGYRASQQVMHGQSVALWVDC